MGIEFPVATSPYTMLILLSIIWENVKQKIKSVKEIIFGLKQVVSIL